ncbi:site-specific DNA-methyltransferase [Dysosmobacter segnis]|uniref:Site-specific DNA-methyltransferase n=1 Tax=Dysosmobacter segnis TaxID=2763042 RepID=A0A923MGK0_9FIRM|nr:site-specific DNA-methyltransferase [Dysosmobacter segnis]MBC5769198.1 site-specific DNA-methyltransferase [Dysosmobacter segnis]
MPTLEWIGKSKVINHHQDVPFRVLERKYSFDENGQHDEDNGSENMIIRGDNLEALKALLPRYEGRVKCIYIDPPYNTGNEGWVYNDNVNDPKIKKWLGEVVGKEGEDLTRHDKWLCMMYPRLKLLQKLLADDGVIFVSLDFHEQPFMRLIMDEIFGASNYVSEIACVNKPSGRSDDKYIATAHESIIVYRKSPLLTLGGFEPEEKITKRYNKRDTDGRLYREEDLRKRGTHDERTDRPNLFYPFFFNQETGELIVGGNDEKTPDGFIRIEPMKSKDIQGTWRWGQDTANAQKTYIHPRYMPNKQQWSLFEWEYLDERGAAKPTTLWDFKDVNSERGTEVFIKYLGFKKEDFPNPKPVGTIQRILQIATAGDDIILDSFAGSGTTAHAVLNMNKADGGHRKFILVEMMDYADSITAERVKRVIRGYGEGKNAVEGTGGNFSFYDLGEPLLVGDCLNEAVAPEKIREYIWFMETKQPYAPPSGGNPYYLGKHNNTGYYFYYEPQRVTVLGYAFLSTIMEKADGTVIYADRCSISEDKLAKMGVTFKKIPRDISRL